MPDPIKRTVASTTPAYDRAEKRRKLPRDLLGGSAAMYAGRLTYNPPHPGEDTKYKVTLAGKIESDYERRATLTKLYDFFERGIRGAIAAIIAEPIILGEDVPEQIVADLEDADLQGNDLSEFMRAVLLDSLGESGVSHVLIDHPTLAPGATDADRRPTDRPYWCHVLDRNLLNPDDIELVNGVHRRRTARIMETLPDGTERVRILIAPPLDDAGNPAGFVKWGLYVKNEKKEWPELDSEPAESGPMAPHTTIPLVPFYTGRIGPNEAETPFRALADLNEIHYRQRSDLDAFVAKITIAMLHRTGISAKDAEEQTLFATGAVLHTPETAGKAEFIEHTGRSFAAGRLNLQDLENRMERRALEPHVSRSPNQTATGRAIDFTTARTEIAAWAIGAGDAIEQCLRFHALYRGIDPKRAGGVTVPHQAKVEPIDSALAKEVRETMLALGYTTKQVAEELKRRRFLGPDLPPPGEPTEQ